MLAAILIMKLPPETEYNRSEYKRDTKYIAGYLLKSSLKCGFVPTPSNNSKDYEVAERDFEPMARCIAENSKKTPIPSFILTILVRAIRFRREVTAWYRLKSCDPDADQQHDAFVSRLQRTLDILRPYTPKPENKQTNATPASSRTTALEVEFAKLDLQDTTEDDEEDTEPPIVVGDLPSVPSVEINLNDESLEETFFLDIITFLKEMQSIRNYVLKRWAGGSDITTKAFVTNTAINIVRQKEYEFDQSLSRPRQYPVDKYPVWCLPALLLHRANKRKKLGHTRPLEPFIKPSPMAITLTVLGQHSSLCFYPVYNGLKKLLHDVKSAPRARPRAEFLFHNLRRQYEDLVMHPNFFDARDMASAIYVMDEQPTYLRFLPEDEVTRGIRHMFRVRKIPFWVTFAMQILLDINDLPEGSVGNPYNDLRREVTKTSIILQEIKTHPNRLVDVHREGDFKAFERLVTSLKAILFEDGVTEMLQGAIEDIPQSKLLGCSDGAVYYLQEAVEGMSFTDDDLVPLVSLVYEKGLFWRRHHLRCGVLIYVLRLYVRKFTIRHDEDYYHVLSVAHLYNICRNLFPDAPHFPDMEFFIQRQDLERFFYGKIPQDIDEAQRQLELVMRGATDAIGGHSYRTISKIGKRLMQSRCIRSPSDTDAVLGNRFDFREHPLLPKEADESTRHFLNSFRDKKQENERIKLFNWPDDARTPDGSTYHRLYFHEFDNTWDPLPALRSVMLWLEADVVNLNFCTPKFVLLCTDILLEILEMFRNDPVFEKDFKKGSVNASTLAPDVALRLLTLTANETKLRQRQPGLPAKRMDQLREVYNIMQKHYLRPVRTKPGEKTWAGDVCIANLVNTEKEPQIGEYWSAVNFFSGRDIFGHPGRNIDPDNLGPAAAENLYKNWDFGGSKEESRMFNALSRFHAGWGSKAIVRRAMEGRY
ncbi:hypothetical protein J4E80_009537 [Alternaria sp. BMP 0032]|nr:hypothetical protein J4E80_009537 [Alternaria sp. BMP 0032]